MTALNEIQQAVKTAVSNIDGSKIRGYHKKSSLFAARINGGRMNGVSVKEIEDKTEAAIDSTGKERDIAAPIGSFIVVKTTGGEYALKSSATVTVDPITRVLKDLEGNTIMGYNLNPDGTVAAEQVNVQDRADKLTPIVVTSDTINITPSTELKLGENLQAEGARGLQLDARPVQLVDNLGIERTVNFNFEVVNAVHGAPGQYKLTVTSPSLHGAGPDYIQNGANVGKVANIQGGNDPYTIYIRFGPDRKPDGYGTVIQNQAAIDAANAANAAAIAADPNAALAPIPDPIIDYAAQVPPVLSLPWEAAEVESNVTLDLSGLTFSGTQTFQKSAPIHNGRKAAEFGGFQISGNIVECIYDGALLKIGRIAVGRANNNDGLEAGVDNTRRINGNSGEILLFSEDSDRSKLINGALRASSDDVTDDLIGLANFSTWYSAEIGAQRKLQDMAEKATRLIE